MIISRIGFFWLLMASLSAMAAPVAPYGCRNGHFPSYDKAGFTLGAIRADADGATHFFDDGTDCPYDTRCRQRSYLVAGDDVLVAKQEDGWMCVWYNGKTREFVGWVSAERVEETSWDPTPELEAWQGRWRFYETGLTLDIQPAPQGAGLRVEGQAYWHGMGDVVHFGSVSGAGVPEGNTLVIAEGDDDWACRLTLTLIGRHLIASDNSNCGGMNVRFDAVYQRLDATGDVE